MSYLIIINYYEDDIMIGNSYQLNYSYDKVEGELGGRGELGELR